MGSITRRDGMGTLLTLHDMRDVWWRLFEYKCYIPKVGTDSGSPLSKPCPELPVWDVLPSFQKSTNRVRTCSSPSAKLSKTPVRTSVTRARICKHFKEKSITSWRAGKTTLFVVLAGETGKKLCQKIMLRVKKICNFLRDSTRCRTLV